MDTRPDSTMADDEADDFGLPPGIVEDVREAIEAGDSARLHALLDPLHPADVADLLEQLDQRERRALLSLWRGGVDGEVLSELDESLREEIIEALPPGELALAVRDLETDDVVDIVEDLDAEGQEAVLGALAAADRIAVEKALAYPEYSAGRLMQAEVVRVPEYWTVGEAIDFLRSGVDLPDQFYHVILVDPRLKPVGYVTLGRILSSPRSTRLRDITEDSFRTVHVRDEEGTVAHVFNKYHLISVPVVDDDDRLVGVITIDDAMTVLDEEHEEDYLALAGVDETSIGDRVWETAKRRFRWLLVTLIAANVAAQVIAQFEATIEQIVLLAVLMPIVASMAGNAGTQAVATAVRALATRDLNPSNALRVVRREIGVGLVNGFAFGAIMGLVVLIFFHEPMIGLVIAVALWITLTLASLGGVLVPLTLNRFGIDPAVASGPFVTTVTDIVGFFVFLGIATMVLL
ncbi:Mg2+ transporter (mgtE) [Rubellimicrobium thermophilum DSM 16684]|uniref:Magnesium transporter MgtE n=1 Tax=Rubellimicrobium thermophilum DSM 16684 TaxID=1123069 RepID=S9R790_9RHOB|nr:magnesium transporter [Rubellimicrobium thermophilum]EPX87858.1 Mg2+ transporter (mgtE) [Rubellimicrobium thermophilum DSM 16684]